MTIKFRFQDLQIWQLAIKTANELFDIADELEVVLAVDTRICFVHNKDIVIVRWEIGCSGGLVFDIECHHLKIAIASKCPKNKKPLRRGACD